MNKETFVKELKNIGIEIKEKQYVKLEEYYKFLIEHNKKINLTSITEKEDVYLKHFYDSLTLVKAIDISKCKDVCDFGTGAGFPGVVLKIIFNNINLTLIESSNKKIKFLQQLIEKLDIKDVIIQNKRVEEYKENKFDLVTCRAVSSLATIAEISSNIVKINGYFIPMKGDIEEEAKKIGKINLLGFVLEKVIKFKLPIENSKRSLVIFKKINNNKEGYPRMYKKIISNPLF